MRKAARDARPSVSHFYLLALGISWAGWIPFAAGEVGLLPVRIPWEVPLLAQFGPSVAAIVLTGLQDGRRGVGALLGQALRWRMPARWYFVAVLTTPAIAGVSLLIHAQLGGHVPGWEAVREWPARYADVFGGGGVYAIDSTPLPSLGPIKWLRTLIGMSPWLAVTNFVLFSLLTGPVSEEFGWRGWLLPRLQESRSALYASVGVGLLWGCWHTGPDFWRLLFEGDLRAFLYPMAMTAGTVPLSIIFCWLYNSTGSSLLPPMLFHASFNATLSVLALTWVSRGRLSIGAELVLGLWVLAAIIVVRYGATHLSARHPRLDGERRSGSAMG